MAKDPADVQLRWMDLTSVSRRLLSEMADVVRELDKENPLSHLEPIDVARGLVSIHDRLPLWVGRTQRLSRDAKHIRQLFKQAKDPNRLIFDDMPKVLDDTQGIGEEEAAQQIARQVRAGLMELRQAYPAMLNRMREMLLAELQVPNASPSMLEELRGRAENIRELGGDHRLEAFIVRLARFEGHDEDMESLVAVHNLGEEAMEVTCELMSAGAVLEEAEIPLEATGQSSWFINEVFTGADTSDFVGSVRCTASDGEMFTGIALELDAANRIFTTLPMVPVPERMSQE